MTQRIACTTLFDITATGVRSHYKNSRIPFEDSAGQTIDDTASWNRSRNQQRNWETLNQLISLRILPENISSPIFDAVHHTWRFEFDVVTPESIALGHDPVGTLLHDCDGVPMILGLAEIPNLDTVLILTGDRVNIWFTVV